VRLESPFWFVSEVANLKSKNVNDYFGVISTAVKVLKSIAVGLAASLASIIVMVGALTLRWFWLLRNYEPPEGGAVAVDFVLVFKSIPHHWLIVLFCFFIGAAWGFRRLR
jgi:hypothetical protein